MYAAFIEKESYAIPCICSDMILSHSCSGSDVASQLDTLDNEARPKLLSDIHDTPDMGYSH